MSHDTQHQELIRISEIFGPTIQGEGALIGRPTVFVRTGGCDYRCSWCDTLYAVDSMHRADWTQMTPEQILQEVQHLSGGIPLTVSLSGGNPAIQPMQSLIELGNAAGYQFCLETQGSIAKDWFSKLNVLTLSPKPPSSGMETDWNTLKECVEAARSGPGQSPLIILKIVVFDEADYQYAQMAGRLFMDLPVYLQPGNHTPPPASETGKAAAEIDMQGILERMRWLVDRTVRDGWHSATVLPQLHTLLWGNLRGV
ncbi:7-carboxy-7-deazaguanine synthase QueE [Roseibium limicola]|uniref:7-carboxy-7-deazaguanine synthase n=1 Tax=Roseibium limicola TaxID=2816037 RepID=A0A939J7Y4_9HYPH|nr:7-carboxy-7-deazaguanine synthase QueE [Roseibium limicola]MBO0346657.1 7-carboxy-7-deazaguanine synthase QueE [Roseibium limicola]